MRNLNNLASTLFLLLIALTPIQLGKHFWPDFASVLGIRIDLLSPTVFLTDILISAFVAASYFRMVKTKKFPPKALTLTLSLFFLGLLVATIFSKNPLLSFWFLFKFLEFASLALAIAVLDFSKIYSKMAYFLILTVFWVVVLELLQFWQQQSLGLWILGERNFNLLTPGIAKVTLGGVQLLRPYATFPHPNVLAGFLLISALAIASLSVKKLVKISALSIGALGILLTFSRTVWLGLLLAAIVGIFLNFGRGTAVRIGILVAGVFIILLIFPQNPIFSRLHQLTASDAHSFTLRAKLAESAIEMFTTRPVTGVGPGNFLPSLPNFWKYQEDVRFLQPVHNVFLLLLAETGIIGATTFLSLLFTTLYYLLTKKPGFFNFLLPTWVIMGIILNLDHYFWTLQQGQILFWSILGLSWVKTQKG